MATADDVVENESGNAPRNVVRRRRWRDETGSAKDDRPVDVSNNAMRVSELDEVLDKRAEETNKEEENKLSTQSRKPV
ncbi:hypothetical protein EIP86_006292 [Pleurotus ostreatoroseus]|nr:hypothetical protein EIP86_006292 [Pleurotus ostreatoroseus]